MGRIARIAAEGPVPTSNGRAPPITRNQVELMQVDNVASPDMPGFAELGISPRPVETTLREILASGGS